MSSMRTGIEDGVVQALGEARERTLALVESIPDEDLVKVHSPLMSPLVWDLGHIAAFEDLWLVHRFAGEPMLRADLAETYDAFETPRSHRGELEFLGPEAARDYLNEVRNRTLEVIESRGTSELHELVLRHEHQHGETMLQTIELARLEGYKPVGDGRTNSADDPAVTRPAGGPSPRRGPVPTGLELLEVPRGECTIGALPVGFAYDNERPRHITDVRGFLIGRTPVTNASYLTFVEGGGYERREWWSKEGWAWKEQFDITRPGGWAPDLHAEWRLGKLEPLDPRRPVVHVSWFEADAFARAHGTRLPTELEWEKAATWDQEIQEARPFPWGKDPTLPGVHANVDHIDRGPRHADACLRGASPYGCLGMMGDVWEWTSSHFGGYPGFRAHPYREYSEVFFSSDYFVLRGGSWATRARVATPTFRNWDYPQRRQIFSGIRVARDAA
jgi:gamma-glutamyl hercynylcysteine S-oxide synthase